MQWATALLICAASSTADVWVYHETVAPSTHDRLLYEALAEPIDSLRERWPDHEPMRRYIAELEQARQDLRSLGEVTIQTRDEARLRFDQLTPSYALYAHEPPRSLHPEAFLHPVLIVRHLEYLSKLADLGKLHRTNLESEDDTGFNRFVEWRVSSVVETEHNGGLTQTETVERMVPRLCPVPLVPLPEAPHRITVEWHCRKHRAWYTECEERRVGADESALLHVIDMGSGIITTQTASRAQGAW